MPTSASAPPATPAVPKPTGIKPPVTLSGATGASRPPTLSGATGVRTPTPRAATPPPVAGSARARAEAAANAVNPSGALAKGSESGIADDEQKTMAPAGEHQPTSVPANKRAPAAGVGTSAGTNARDANPFATQASQVATGDEGERALDLEPGAMVEQYEIIKELGRGGMGVVFQARDTKLGRVVAIKFLTRTGDSFVRRFLVEAQTTARVTHENIVVIHEANTYRGHPYMVLEFLEGDPLSKIIKGRTLSPARTVEIMVPVARALIRAHAFGIVHRDLKPDNIFITQSGTVKVLDFGVAKLFGDSEEDPVSVNTGKPLSNTAQFAALPQITGNLYETLSTGGRVVGTLPFMSPEQFGADVVDERTDLWACGVIMFRLLSGQHPLTEVTNAGLMFSARDVDSPHRSLGEAAPSMPDPLIRLVDKLLRKKKVERHADAAELLGELEALLPTKAGRRLGDEECPYPGLSAFDEGDADRFFGRSREVARAVTLLRDNALLAIVGPSGAGKSSFVRAGLIPELKSQGVNWETFIIRPGRDPLGSVTTLIEQVTGKQIDTAAVQSRLRHEPGYLGQLLRDRARQKESRAMLLVDQFEELYTLVPDEDERNVFTRVLQGVADDPGSPLRLVLSFRSDFLHRIAENAKFADQVMRGLLLLGPPDKEGLREAIIGPAEKADYRFESPEMVDEMLAELKGASAPYPLMQFCLSNLWVERDARQRVLPYQAFQAMGGVAGALAGHADQIIATLSQSAQKVARAMFQRLVTSEGTRAIVDLDEIEGTSEDTAEVHRVLSAFVEARLLISHQDTKTVEIVHEALVAQWPTLRRWMEEGREDVALIEQVRGATRQWDQSGRTAGMLWRGQAAKDASKFLDRFGNSLAAKERDFLNAVIKLDKSAGRRKSVIMTGVIIVLGVMVAGSVIGLITIRGAEAKAVAALDDAKLQQQRAEEAAEAANKAKAEAELNLEKFQKSQGALSGAQADLAKKNQELEATLSTVQKAKDDAVAAKESAEKASAEATRQKAEAEKAKGVAQAALRDAEQAKKDLKANLDAAEKKIRDQQKQLAKYN
ncbi:MAG: protein kinase [Kofleriaceae bacterium]